MLILIKQLACLFLLPDKGRVAKIGVESLTLSALLFPTLLSKKAVV